MSRIKHAICALLAASATSVKSRRNASVDGPLAADEGLGGGAVAAAAPKLEEERKEVGDCRVEDCDEDEEP